MKSKISVVIPYYESDLGKPAILKRLTDSLVGQDEIMIVWNNKMGYAKSINKGLANAHGDYLVVMNDDLIQTQGSLVDLCDEKSVTSPLVNYGHQDFWGCCFCIPRRVYEKVGGLSEIYRISYFDDDDYINTLRQAGIPMIGITSVNFDHPEGGRTLHTMPDHHEFFEENKLKFIEKWGGTPEEMTAFWQEHGRLPKEV